VPVKIAALYEEDSCMTLLADLVCLSLDSPVLMESRSSTSEHLSALLYSQGQLQAPGQSEQSRASLLLPLDLYVLDRVHTGVT